MLNIGVSRFLATARRLHALKEGPALKEPPPALEVVDVRIAADKALALRARRARAATSTTDKQDQDGVTPGEVCRPMLGGGAGVIIIIFFFPTSDGESLLGPMQAYLPVLWAGRGEGFRLIRGWVVGSVEALPWCLWCRGPKMHFQGKIGLTSPTF